VTDVKGFPTEGRRARRARQTRRRILAAAEDLFTGNGYAATSVQQVADRADVAWQTVYAVFGTKAAILSALFDVTVAGDDEPVPVAGRPFVQEIAGTPDPAGKMRILARQFREVATRTAGVLSVVESAASTDPEIAALWRTLQDQRLTGMRTAATDLESQGALRPGLGVPRAADILWCYSGPWAWRALVAGRGWSPREYERWLARILYDELSAPRD
jgi:AcrR family transcriptional regulator